MLCHAPNSCNAAQGGRPDLKGPLVAELEDQPAAGAPTCKNIGPTSPQPPVTGRDCSCMGGTSLVPHRRLRLQQVSCSPRFHGFWAQGCPATCPGPSCLLISHETLIFMLLGHLQRHGVTSLGWDGHAHGWKPRADLASAPPVPALLLLAGADAASQLEAEGRPGEQHHATRPQQRPP